MKVIKLLVLIFITLTGCQSNPNTYSIEGTVNVEDGKTIYRIEADQNNQPSIIDSTQIISGKFGFEGNAMRPEINFLQIEGIQGTFPIIIEGGAIKTTLFKDSLSLSKATGTISNNGFMDYKNQTKGFINSLNAIGSEMQKAVILKDSLLIIDLRDQYQGIQEQIETYEMDFVRNNSDSFISVLILERYLANNTLGVQAIKEIYEQFSERIRKSRSAEAIEEKINAPIPAAEIGQVAPMFEGPNPLGELVGLKENLGKVTVVEFWASWCRPCRVENPGFVRMYNRLQPKGLEIVAVSLDKEKGKWLKAIEDDGLIWQHVSNLKFWRDPIAELYNVSAIPATFILDESGTIVARNLRGRELENKIEELLN